MQINSSSLIPFRIFIHRSSMEWQPPRRHSHTSSMNSCMPSGSYFLTLSLCMHTNMESELNVLMASCDVSFHISSHIQLIIQKSMPTFPWFQFKLLTTLIEFCWLPFNTWQSAPVHIVWLKRMILVHLVWQLICSNDNMCMLMTARDNMMLMWCAHGYLRRVVEYLAYMWRTFSSQHRWFLLEWVIINIYIIVSHDCI